jgi:hypothetical protein
LKKTNPITSLTRRDIPMMVTKRVRYHDAPIPGATSYRIYLPKKKKSD